MAKKKSDVVRIRLLMPVAGQRDGMSIVLTTGDEADWPREDAERMEKAGICVILPTPDPSPLRKEENEALDGE